MFDWFKQSTTTSSLARVDKTKTKTKQKARIRENLSPVTGSRQWSCCFSSLPILLSCSPFGSRSNWISLRYQKCKVRRRVGIIRNREWAFENRSWKKWRKKNYKIVAVFATEWNFSCSDFSLIAAAPADSRDESVASVLRMFVLIRCNERHPRSHRVERESVM